MATARSTSGDAATVVDHLAPLRWRDAHAGTSQLIWCYSDALLPWAAWLQQLDQAARAGKAPADLMDGIEIANNEKIIVPLRELFEDPELEFVRSTT